MSWIDNGAYYPLEKGYYKCLVIKDDFGTLTEAENELFDGDDWSHTKSHRQFIRFWWSDKETYQIISDRWYDHLEKWQEEQAENARNFGGL